MECIEWPSVKRKPRIGKRTLKGTPQGPSSPASATPTLQARGIVWLSPLKSASSGRILLGKVVHCTVKICWLISDCVLACRRGREPCMSAACTDLAFFQGRWLSIGDEHRASQLYSDQSRVTSIYSSQELCFCGKALNLVIVWTGS